MLDIEFDAAEFEAKIQSPIRFSVEMMTLTLITARIFGHENFPGNLGVPDQDEIWWDTVRATGTMLVPE